MVYDPVTAAFALGLCVGLLLALLWRSYCVPPATQAEGRTARTSPRAARGELKMVMLVRTDLGMQKGSLDPLTHVEV